MLTYRITSPRHRLALVALAALATLAMHAPTHAADKIRVDANAAVFVVPESGDETGLLPTLEPTHSFAMPYDGALTDPVLSHDGRTLYGTHIYETVNAWQVIVYHWPELTAAAAAIAWLLVLWRLRRTLKRRRAIGEPHCRKCDYQLTGVNATHCPECGADLAVKRAIVPGRHVARRLAVMVTMLIALPAGVGAIYMTDTPRDGTASAWFTWSSPTLHQWLMRAKWHDGIPEYTRSDVVAMDAETGHVTWRLDEVCNDVGPWVDELPNESLWRAHLTADDRVVVVYRPHTLYAWDTASHELIAQVNIDPARPSSIARDSQSMTVYGVDSLYASNSWDMKTGEHTDVVDLDVVRQQVTDTNPDDPPFVYVWELGGDRKRVHVFPDDGRVVQSNVVDGGIMLLRAPDPDGWDLIVEWDLNRKSEVAKVRVPGVMSVFAAARISDNCDTMVVAGAAGVPHPTHRQRNLLLVMVRDHRSQRWTHLLDTTQLTDLGELVLSRSGRRVIVTGSDRGPLWWENRVLVFDLPR